MLTNPFRWTKCMMKKKALVFSPGTTFPFRLTSFPASLVVALSIAFLFFSRTPSQLAAATAIPYL